jgi:hypothetical protein
MADASQVPADAGMSSATRMLTGSMAVSLFRTWYVGAKEALPAEVR